jgi:hypothetical protein
MCCLKLVAAKWNITMITTQIAAQLEATFLACCLDLRPLECSRNAGQLNIQQNCLHVAWLCALQPRMQLQCMTHMAQLAGG